MNHKCDEEQYEKWERAFTLDAPFYIYFKGASVVCALLVSDRLEDNIWAEAVTPVAHAVIVICVAP